MSTGPIKTVSTIIPTMRYEDAPAAIEWLCKAFGFEKRLVVQDGDVIHHAQLTFGNGMIMVGSHRDSEYDAVIRQPADIGGESQSPYILVEDCDAHHAQAKAAGAEMIVDLYSPDHGGRAYTCRDPQGHIWNFGSYDPWADV